MKNLLPAIICIVLVITLAVLTVSLDRGIDRDRLAQVSTIPNYVPSGSQDAPADSQDKEGDDAPNISLTDAQGNTVTLEQFRGKTVVLHFWASWVTSSTRELTMFQNAYNELKDQVHFLIINTTSDSRETREAADQLIADGGFTFPVYYDLDASAANEYEVTSLPTSFFIDANGKAIAYAAGELSRNSLNLGLQHCEHSVQQAATATGTQTTETTDPTETTAA